MKDGLIFLAQATLILVLPQALLHLLRLSGRMPLVVVQILVGILLGPSLFGRIAPDSYRLLFDPSALAPLSGVGSIAVLFFAFLTGLHVDAATLRRGGRGFAAITLASIVLPTLLGFLAGLGLVAGQAVALGPAVEPWVFAAGIAICTGVTALPVLSAILIELDLAPSRLGQLALGIAAANDIALWLLLGTLLSIVSAQANQSLGLPATLVILLLYAAAMIRLVGPLTGRLLAATMQEGRLGSSGLALLCGLIFVSAGVTQSLGLHAILGAFIAGAVLPRRLSGTLVDQLQLVVISVLMPFYFMLAGLKANVDFGAAEFWQIFLATTACAVIGKLGGTAIAARSVGETWPVALGLGALVQTKGLMEVIVMTALLESGIITPTVFSALLLMAVVTTAAAMPLLRLIARCAPAARMLPDRPPAEQPSVDLLLLVFGRHRTG